MRLRVPLGRLGRARDGVAAVEFALVAPVFLVMICGMFNVGQMVYGRAVLNGAVEKAARNSSLESGNVSLADERVKDAVLPVLPGAEFSSERVSYYDFADIGRAEKWNDKNKDGECNNGESYTDENNSGSWDESIGADGNGGASDVVIYKVTIQYDPAFTIPFAPDDWQRTTLQASAIRKNQPFALQQKYATTAGTCA